jgi:hypothetical protein
MKIVKVYRTSKGLFWDRAEAEKKKNRKKEYYRNVFPESYYEPVIETYVLVTETEVDSSVRDIGTVSMIFELCPVEIA